MTRDIRFKVKDSITQPYAWTSVYYEFDETMPVKINVLIYPNNTVSIMCTYVLLLFQVYTQFTCISYLHSICKGFYWRFFLFGTLWSVATENNWIYHCTIGHPFVKSCLLSQNWNCFTKSQSLRTLIYIYHGKSVFILTLEVTFLFLESYLI